VVLSSCRVRGQQFSLNRQDKTRTTKLHEDKTHETHEWLSP
jgi:hypothetical protein